MRYSMYSSLPFNLFFLMHHHFIQHSERYGRMGRQERAIPL